MFGVTSIALQTHIQKTLVEGLQYFFSTRSDFKYNEDSKSTGISIYGEYPQRLVRYPAVVIGNISGDLLLRTIGSRTFREIRGQRIVSGLTIPNALCGYILGGGHRVSVSVEVAANTAAERRVVSDYLANAMHLYLKDWLPEHGLHLINISKGRGKDVLIGNQYIRWDELVFNFYTEWRERIYDVPLITKLNSVGISTYF